MWRTRDRRLAAALVLVLAAALPAAAGAQPAGEPAFDWSVPARLGADRDGDGLLDYAGSAEEVGGGPWRVDFEVAPASCRRGSTYRWLVDGEPASGPREDCRFARLFAEEGSHEVALQVERGGETAVTRREVVVQDLLIVSIGDSVASGEGNPDAGASLLRGARWQSRRCHRSAHAGTAQAALALERGDARTSVTFVHLACSGATIDEGLLGRYAGIEPVPGVRPRLLPPQVEELRRIAAVHEVDALLVSVGANDMHFGPAAAFCITTSACQRKPFVPDRAEGPPRGEPARTLAQELTDALRRLPGRYDALDAMLPPALDRARVHVVEYFDPTHDEHGRTCRDIAGVAGSGITEAEARFAQESLLGPLNRELRSAADRHGWRLVGGVADAFRRHGYCAPRRERWVRTLLESIGRHGRSRAAPWLAGTLHPNEAGHRATARLIAADLREGLALARAEERDDDGDDDGGGDGDGPSAWVLIAAGVAALGAAAAGLVAVRRRRRR